MGGIFSTREGLIRKLEETQFKQQRQLNLIEGEIKMSTKKFEAIKAKRYRDKNAKVKELAVVVRQNNRLQNSQAMIQETLETISKIIDSQRNQENLKELSKVMTLLGKHMDTKTVCKNIRNVEQQIIKQENIDSMMESSTENNGEIEEEIRRCLDEEEDLTMQSIIDNAPRSKNSVKAEIKGGVGKIE